MKLNISVDGADIEKQAREFINKCAKEEVTRQIRSHFASKNYFSQTDGIATTIIRQTVDSYILSDKFKETAERVIAEIGEKHIREALEKLLASRSRKAFFEQVPHVPEA